MMSLRTLRELCRMDHLYLRKKQISSKAYSQITKLKKQYFIN